MAAMETATAGVPQGEPGKAAPRARRWHRGPFVRREVRVSVGTLLVFLFVFYVVLPLLASHRTQVRALAHINVGYLVLGVLLEIAALAAYAQLTHSVLPARRSGTVPPVPHQPVDPRPQPRVPGGTAPGAALGYRLLTQSGVTGADTGFALGTQGIGSAVVLNVLFWCSLVRSWSCTGSRCPRASTPTRSTSASILVVVAAAVGVVLLGAFGGLFYLLTRGQERAARSSTPGAGRSGSWTPTGARPSSSAWPAGSPCWWTTGPSCAGRSAGRPPTGSSTPPRCGCSWPPSGTSSRPWTC